VRRLRRKLPSVQIVVGFWTLSDDEARQVQALRETGADVVVTSLRHAVEQVAVAKKNSAHGEAPVVLSPAAE
jgi:hypothetical protein